MGLVLIFLTVAACASTARPHFEVSKQWLAGPCELCQIKDNQQRCTDNYLVCDRYVLDFEIQLVVQQPHVIHELRCRQLIEIRFDAIGCLSLHSMLEGLER